MKIEKFRLTHIGPFRLLEIPLAPTEQAPFQVTVLVGNNGAGKTSLLRALATSLSWFVARLRSEKGSGAPIPEKVISNGTTSAVMDIVVFNDQEQQPNNYEWTLAKVRQGRKGDHSNLGGVSALADYYRTQLSDNEQVSLPLIAFYSVERVVLDIPLKIKKNHNFFSQLEGYDNALNQGVDFRRFFEWFREREDTENESVISQEMLDKIQGTLKNMNPLRLLWSRF